MKSSCYFLEQSMIESIGEYASEEFLWAVGVPHLKFQSQPNTTCGSTQVCYETWQLVNYANSTLSISAKNDNQYCYQSTALNDNATYQIFQCPQSKFKIECFFMENSITSFYHILRPLEVGVQDISFNKNSKTKTRNITISCKYFLILFTLYIECRHALVTTTKTDVVSSK